MQSKCPRKWISFTQEPVAIFCKCKSACTRKCKENSSCGCPCKGRNMLCTDECKCGTSSKPCRNRVNYTCISSWIHSRLLLLNCLKAYEIIWVFPFFRIRMSSRHLPMKAVEFDRGWKDWDLVSLQALPILQLRNSNKLKKTTMWRYFLIRLSIVFFLTCIPIMMCSRINICHANATNVCDIWLYCQRVRPSGRPEGLTRRQIIEPWEDMYML